MKLLSFFDNTAKVYVIEAEDFIKADSKDLDLKIQTLSEVEQEKFNRYKNDEAKYTFLTARFYLREILEKWIATTYPNSLNINKVRIEISSSGKPYLADYPTIFFNISHTKGLILIAIANSSIGVDVEHIERNADKESILKHFFSENEQKSYFSQTESIKQYAFFIGWTRKEAILKATGEGLTKMSNYEVSFEPKADIPIIKNCSNYNFIIKDFVPSDGYTASVAILTK